MCHLSFKELMDNFCLEIGTFLFARLLLYHLKTQDSLEEFQYELDPARFPTDLDEV